MSARPPKITGVPARPTWWHTLQASKQQALLAVDLHNRSAGQRSLEGFVVHMHLAWLYLLHARFQRDGIDFRYWNSDARRLVRVDGEVKTWELARCLAREFPDPDSPVRRNVEFFIRLRNKVEHRYERLVATAVAGKSQAHLFNYEEHRVAVFGRREGLGDDLRFPIFVSSLTADAVQALKRTHRQIPKRITSFIREYDASLPEEVQTDWRYDFRVILLAQTGPRTDADAVVRFVREDEMTESQRQARDVVQTIVREKQVPVQNMGRYKPGKVAEKVAQGLGVRFTISDHTEAWRHLEVRPPKGADHPERTDQRYCYWDEPHRDYLYTEAWLRMLVDKLRSPSTFRSVVGRSEPGLKAKRGRAAKRRSKPGRKSKS